MITIRTGIFFICIFVVSFLSAQQNTLQFDHLNSQDGLASNSVFSIIQDRKGFLWFGTYDGLNKYDGYEITVYKTIEEDSTSISDNKISTICEDDEGNLWIGTWNNGLNKYNPLTGKFTRYQYSNGSNSGISSNRILSLLNDKNGNLWIGTEGGGLNKFIYDEEKFYYYRNKPDDPSSLSDNSVFSIYCDVQGTLWIGTNAGGLNRFDESKQSFTSFKHNPVDPKSISSDFITAITEDKFGNLWVATGSAGLNKFNRSTGEFTRYSKSSVSSACSDVIWSIHEDKQGVFWMGTNDAGLSILDRTSEEFFCYKKVYNTPEGLSDNTINTICEDRTGILWFGTWNGGVNKYSRIDKKFNTISHDPEDMNSLSSNSIYSIYEDRFGDLWIGTDISGLNRIDRKSNTVFRYYHHLSDINGIGSNTINSICEDNAGNIWIGTNDNGLNRYNRASNKFTHYKHDPHNPGSICNNQISQLFLDSNGDLWIGIANGGLDKLTKGDNRFIHYKHDPNDPASINPEIIFTINEDKAGNLWIGTNGGGLSMFNKKTGKCIHYRYDWQNPHSLSHNAVSVIHVSKNGTLWIGTNGGGLNKFDTGNKTFKRFREKDGLPNDMICGILEDDGGHLWISTYNGLSRFDTNSEKFRNFTVEDGLQGNEFNNWAYFKSKNGTMYFGGTNGINFFHPDSLEYNLHIPPIVITDFQLLHKQVNVGYDPAWKRTILTKSISETEQIELNHNDNIFSFEFAALDFHNPGKNMYAYILEGFDHLWTYTNADRRFVTYTNLDPGEYIFRVKGSNNDGVWNENGVSLKIIINSPWWATWWAYILYIIFVLMVLYVSTKIYVNRQRLKHRLLLETEHTRKLEDIDKMKSSFYANISHEFRTPLMLILGPVEKLLNKLTDDESKKHAGLIKANANRLLNLINQLMDLSKIEAGKMKLQASFGNIAQYVKGLVMEFESVAEQKDISLKMNLEKDTVEAYFDKDKLEKIITNVMSNAIKFTPAGGNITVSLKETSEKNVEIVIRDSGIGIPKNELPKVFDRFYQVDGSQTREYEGTGIGLALTKELVEIHKGRIFIDSEEDHWTEVKLYFPVGKENLLVDEIIESADHEFRRIQTAEVLEKSAEPEDSLNELIIDKTIILIVEDNPDVRNFLKDSLKEIYHVEEAANGEQGLRKAEKYIPDLIISDIMMPKMDGYEMMKRIKQDEKTSHIPVILLTAKSDKESKLEGLGLGADDYLVKPFDTDELLVRVKNLIDMRKFLQEKFGRGVFIPQKIDKTKLNAIDEQFMNRIMNVIEEHLSEEDFSIEEFGKDVGMSRSQMHRKLKALTGKSASVFLRTVRLAKAKQMIEEKKGNISEISYQVGFSSPAYFSRCFKEEFGYSPSEIN